MTYPVSEDTLFLKKFLDQLELNGKQFLEIGTGNGEIAVEAARRGAEVTAVDTDPEAVERTEKKAAGKNVEIEVIQSDLFENVDQRFDFIAFNPPYLPGKRESGADALVGGRKGIELTERFLEEARNYLAENGEIYFIGSSLAELGQIEKEYNLEIVEEKQLWFETLYLYRLSA